MPKKIADEMKKREREEKWEKEWHLYEEKRERPPEGDWLNDGAFKNNVWLTHWKARSEERKVKMKNKRNF